MAHIIHSLVHNHDDTYFRRDLSMHIGEGDPSQTGMVVLTTPNLDSGPFTDVTSQVLNDDATSVAIFEDLGAGNALYIGCDEAIYGLEIDTTTAMVLGSGRVELEMLSVIIPGVLELWLDRGSIVTDFDTATTQYGGALLQTVQRDNIRFGVREALNKKIFGGYNKYWYRIRVYSGSITTTPEVNQIKYIQSITKINLSGITEFFGDSRFLGDLLFHQNLFDDTSHLGMTDPSSVDVDYSTNIEIGSQKNSFVTGNKDARVIDVTIPLGLDTSKSIETKIIFKVSNNNAGDVVITQNNVKIKTGDVIDGSALEENVVGPLTIGASEQDEVKILSYLTTVKDLVDGDRLVISFVRDATANPSPSGDTYNGNVHILGVRCYGYFWRK